MRNQCLGLITPGERAGIWLGALLLYWVLAPKLHGAGLPIAEHTALSPSRLHAYAAYTLARMGGAFCLSLAFAMLTGYAAAHSHKARAFLLPAIDVLQSVPVFGYLVAAISLFSGTDTTRRFAFEAASVLAIFSSQVWNMSLSIYQSLSGLPEELRAVASVHRMGRWQRLRVLELPCATRALLWNAMISFGSGWFFVIQSEAFSVLNEQVRLPGLGAFMAASLEQGDVQGAIWATLWMLLILLLIDQMLWRPLLAWADRFKLENTGSGEQSRSWMFDLLKRLRPSSRGVCSPGRAPVPEGSAHRERPLLRAFLRAFRHALLGVAWTLVALAGVSLAALCVWAIYRAGRGAREALMQIGTSFDTREAARVLRLGALTFLRVLATTALATLLWVPLGIWMGRRPKISRFTEPLAQMAAAFPANMTFPLIAGLLVRHQISMNWGSILLLVMGAQWYILFNVSAASASIPGDLAEVAQSCRLRGIPRWKTLFLPAVFPAWVTGACTAAGGAWNASVVAEMATWGGTTLHTEGLGSYLTLAAETGDLPRLLAALGTMTGLVLLTNKLVWRPLFALASRRFNIGN